MVSRLPKESATDKNPEGPPGSDSQSIKVLPPLSQDSGGQNTFTAAGRLGAAPLFVTILEG